MNHGMLLKLSSDISALIGYANSASAIVDCDDESTRKRWADGMRERAESATKSLDKMISIIMEQPE